MRKSPKPHAPCLWLYRRIQYARVAAGRPWTLVSLMRIEVKIEVSHLAMRRANCCSLHVPVYSSA